MTTIMPELSRRICGTRTGWWPTRILAWCEENELAERLVMRDGPWPR
jgi:hypothetical protein